jgi:hypothetical protein
MAEDVMMLQNDLSPAGIRMVHVMAPLAFPFAPDGTSLHLQEAQIGGLVIPAWAEVKIWQDEIRLHHLEATWRPRGDLIRYEMRFACQADCASCRGSGCTWQRLVALWGLQSGERIRQAINDASVTYALATGFDPQFAWIRSLPRGVEYGAEVLIGGVVTVNLYSAEWMPARAIAVGRGN